MPADRTRPDPTAPGPRPTSPLPAAAIARLVGLAVVVGVVAFVVVDTGLDLDAVRESVAGTGTIAAVLFVLTYATLTVALVPGAILTTTGGLLFAAIRLRDFVLGTGLGIIPGVVDYTIIGARADDPASPLFLGAVAALVVLAIAGGSWVRRRRSGDHAPAPDQTTTDSDPTPADAVEV